jgi:hypothetical protein
MRHLIALSAVALLSCPAVGESRISHSWSFDELKAKSDVVVIAQKMSTRETGVKAVLYDIQPPFPVVELNTQFKMLTLLKGYAERKEFLLRHYRTDTELMPGGVLNGPVFLDFSRAATGVYLLFLTREADGLYATTSGQVDPDQSAFALPKNALTVFPR